MSTLAVIGARCAEIPLRTVDDRHVGIYLLIDRGEVVYVGQSCNVIARVRLHEADVDAAGALAKVFDRAIWFAVDRSDLLVYEGALIRALRPRYNRRAPAYRGRDNAVLAELGLPLLADEIANEVEFRARVRRWSGGARSNGAA